VSAWLALLDAAPTEDVELVAEAGTGVLAGWRSAHGRPHPQARRVDPRLLDPDGGPAWVSLVWPAEATMPLYDDPAVLHARRAVLSGVSPRAVSTLVLDSTHFAGSVWVVEDDADLRDDPFRRLAAPRCLRVGPELLGHVARPPGPALERYAGAPWPWDRVSG